MRQLFATGLSASPVQLGTVASTHQVKLDMGRLVILLVTPPKLIDKESAVVIMGVLLY